MEQLKRVVGKKEMRRGRSEIRKSKAEGNPKSELRRPKPRWLTSRHDLHDLQPVPRAELAPGELRWRDGFAVVLDDHTARREILGGQELLN